MIGLDIPMPVGCILCPFVVDIGINGKKMLMCKALIYANNDFEGADIDEFSPTRPDKCPLQEVQEAKGGKVK